MKEYLIRGPYRDWPEIFNSLESLQLDLDYLQDKYPDDTFRIMEREVSEWKEIQRTVTQG